MNNFRIRFLGVVLLSLAGLASGQEMLGEPPKAPKSVTGLPGSQLRDFTVTGGFSVNINSREAVRSFFNAVYRASDNVPMQTTAYVPTCTPGTNSLTYRQAVLRRINWFRALAGLPAAVTLDGTASGKDQQAAVIMSANDALSHYPPNTWSCYTSAGAEAAENSNLALGYAGPDAITAYIWDFGFNNRIVGHRRWLLYPQTQVMGTGDVPAANGFGAANATWVFDANFGGPRPATRTAYVAWPPAGYVPGEVVYPYWSFALAGGNFTNATVTMRSNGVNVAVALQPYVPGYGENTLVWVPMGLDAASGTTKFPFNGADTVYTVTVTNIQTGLSVTGFTYTVTLFDPAVPGPDYAPPTISGPANPAVGQANAYTFTPVPNATGYQWRVVRPSAYQLSDGAETGLGNFTVVTTSGYAVLDASVKATGTYSFHLAHPEPDDQILTLNQAFVPTSSGTLTFKSRLGWAGNVQTARVQLSTDNGSSWSDAYAQIGTDNGGETIFTTRSVALGAYAGQELRLRFKYDVGNGSYYYQTSAGVGWYLDDIVVTNVQTWQVVSTNLVAGTNFTFTPPQTTNYNLDVRAYLFTEFPLDWGPAKPVTAVAAPLTITMNQPIISSGQMQLGFVTSGAGTFKLLQANQPAGPWTTNSSALLTTNVPGSVYRFTVAITPGARFFRVKSP